MKDKIVSVLKDILGDFGLDDGISLTPEKRLQDDLGLDSLEMVEITMELEDTFNVELKDEDMEKVVTVGQLVELIREKQHANIQ